MTLGQMRLVERFEPYRGRPVPWPVNQQWVSSGRKGRLARGYGAQREALEKFGDQVDGMKGGRQAQSDLASVPDNPSSHRKEIETQPFDACRTQVAIGHGCANGGSTVVGDAIDCEPGGIGPELLAGHGGRRQAVLEFIMDMFNRTRLLAVPFDQFWGRKSSVGANGQVPIACPVIEQFPLGFD